MEVAREEGWKFWYACGQQAGAGGDAAAAQRHREVRGTRQGVEMKGTEGGGSRGGGTEKCIPQRVCI